jgi:branched-chain amino acid transport system substrate-binding protein
LRRMIVVAAGAGLMLAACGSSGGGGTKAGGGSGSPIGLMMITATGTGNPGYDAIPGAQAGIADVNAAGGVKGRPLKLTVCDTHGDPNQASACAQKALSTSSVVATAGNDDYTGGGPITGVLNGKMAAVGHKPYTAADFTAPSSFPVDCGGVGIVGGEAEWLATQGSKHLVALVYDSAGGQQIIKFLNGELSALFPKTTLTAVTIPATATDMTPYAAQAISKKPDGVMLALPQGSTVAAIGQLRAQGYTAKIQTASTVMTPSAIKQIGDTTGIQATGCDSYDSKGHADFLASMAKNKPGADTGDEALNGWMAVHAFATVMSASSQPITKAGVLAAFNAESSLSTDGLTPTINFTKETPVPGFGRVFAPTAVNHDIEGGRQTDVKPTQFLDYLTGKILS